MCTRIRALAGLPLFLRLTRVYDWNLMSSTQEKYIQPPPLSNHSKQGDIVIVDGKNFRIIKHTYFLATHNFQLRPEPLSPGLRNVIHRLLGKDIIRKTKRDPER